MIDEQKEKEIRHLERKLREELSNYQTPVPIARIAQDMQKTDREAEWYVESIRKVVSGSPIILTTDESGQKCAGIKVSTKSVRFRKPQ